MNKCSLSDSSFTGDSVLTRLATQEPRAHHKKPCRIYSLCTIYLFIIYVLNRVTSLSVTPASFWEYLSARKRASTCNLCKMMTSNGLCFMHRNSGRCGCYSYRTKMCGFFFFLIHIGCHSEWRVNQTWQGSQCRKLQILKLVCLNYTSHNMEGNFYQLHVKFCYCCLSLRGFSSNV